VKIKHEIRDYVLDIRIPELYQVILKLVDEL